MRPGMILSLAWNDCKARFAGSALGIFWALAGPLVTVGIYWFVYTVALGGASVDGVPYALWLMAGIAPWFFFAEGLTGAASCFWDYRFLVRKMRFRAECLPLVRVCSAFFVHAGFLALVWLCLWISGFPPAPGQLWIFYWMAGGFLLILGLGKLCALLCVQLRDVAHGVNVAVQLGFWITPVFWSPDTLPEGLRWLCVYNPAAVLVRGCRAALLNGGSLPVWDQCCFWTAVALLNLAGYLLMKRLRPTLADKL